MGRLFVAPPPEADMKEPMAMEPNCNIFHGSFGTIIPFALYGVVTQLWAWHVAEVICIYIECLQSPAFLLINPRITFNLPADHPQEKSVG